jgi:polysaccharide pyruvyl transferase WcaK-like protein
VTLDLGTESTHSAELRSTADRLARETCQKISELQPRIALLTPYEGGNLGDAAIQDAMIANLRLRLSGAQFSGVCLNCNNFVERHGVGAFPLCGTNRPFYRMSSWILGGSTGQGQNLMPGTNQKGLNATLIKRELKRVPGLWKCLKAGHAWVTGPWREMRHCFQAYRFLRTQDLLIVSGGGQLDEEWGGAWGHPFALFKWAVLARIARIPYVMASIGAQKAVSSASRLFMSTALRLAIYRSYRDKNSREIAVGLLKRAAEDPIVPDLALSLPHSELPSRVDLRTLAKGRRVVGISPIAYAKPGRWPNQDRDLYERYVRQMSEVLSQLLKRGFFLVLVWSSISDDESVIPELLGHLDRDAMKRVGQQVHIPAITTWRDLFALLLDIDVLIASRLHSMVLAFVAQRPTVAISFDPKVDWVMEDLGQRDYLLQIRDFTAAEVIKALERIQLRRNAVMERIGAYRDAILPALASQYDALADLALGGHRRRDGGKPWNQHP